ncbi:myb-like DNA-binding protein [Thraustotheca clavata]|uniref:Myb-like DNA-binding protein n=1 Tax=Thraustotheca clavata TaxID=74557 RepID=A0A1V9Z2M7_9STRA|nr:myb-like DNA-binding protein [Thraustotheca clavata]
MGRTGKSITTWRCNISWLQLSHCTITLLEDMTTVDEVKFPSTGPWTLDQDEELRKAMEIYRDRNWKAVAELVPGRDDAQCLQRWQKVLRPGLVKGHWSHKEDSLLRDLVLNLPKSQSVKWKNIADRIEGRTPKQCRERWKNHLDPSIVRGDFSAEEDQALETAFKECGNQWSKISKMMAGRTQEQVKKRYKELHPDFNNAGQVGRPSAKKARRDVDVTTLSQSWKDLLVEEPPPLLNNASLSNLSQLLMSDNLKSLPDLSSWVVQDSGNREAVDTETLLNVSLDLMQLRGDVIASTEIASWKEDDVWEYLRYALDLECDCGCHESQECSSTQSSPSQPQPIVLPVSASDEEEEDDDDLDFEMDKMTFFEKRNYTMNDEENLEGLTMEQYNALKRAFSKYDKMKTGAIALADFENLSKDLGEVFDNEEVQVAKQSMQDGDVIHFTTFLKWWTDESKV